MPLRGKVAMKVLVSVQTVSLPVCRRVCRVKVWPRSVASMPCSWQSMSSVSKSPMGRRHCMLLDRCTRPSRRRGNCG